MSLSEPTQKGCANPKSACRASARRLRDAMPPELRRAASEHISQNIIELEFFHRCDRLFCYYPTAEEADILPVAREALRLGKTVGFPVCDYAAGEMEFYAVDDLFGMTPRGKLNIPEPNPNAARRITPTGRTMILFPGLLFDRAGHRIGYGRGMYDKYVRRFPELLSSAMLTGVCYAALLSDTQIPSAKTDVNMTLIVTEKGLFVPSRV